MPHAAAHAANTMHGFIQMHLAGASTTKRAQDAATEVNKEIKAGTLAGAENASETDGTVLVYVEFAKPPAPWDLATRAHQPANDATPAHDRVVALRQLIAQKVKDAAGTPFFDFGLSHNWCCYGDE